MIQCIVIDIVKKNLKISLYSFLLSLLFFVNVAGDPRTNPFHNADEKLKSPLIIGSFNIPFSVIDDQNGVFIEILREIEKRAHILIKIKVYSSAQRARIDFAEEKILDAYFPALYSILRLSRDK